MERVAIIQGPAHEEAPIGTANGFVALIVALAAAGRRRMAAVHGHLAPSGSGGVRSRSASLLLIAGVLTLAGLYTLQPNEAAIIQLFGAYRGTSRVPGLRATNPFYTRKKMSLRARNLNGDRLKVNDKRGNPIEIAAVVVWHVDDTAKAAFDVDDYENFVKVQSEAAVRHLASSFAYDAEDPRGRRPRADAARERRHRRPRARARAAGAARAGRRRGRGGAADAPRVRAGDRAGDAAPAAGRGDHRRAPEDRARRRVDGRRWR